MLASNKTIVAELFRDNPAEIAAYLTEKFAKNDYVAARTSLGLVMQGQNVQMLARDAGLRRESLYRTFGGRIDPQLSRILKLFDALNVRACVVPSSPSDPQTTTAPGAVEAFAVRLTQAFEDNHFDKAVRGLKEVALSQNVSVLARASGLERRSVYRTFGGTVDPQLSRILKLFDAMQLRFVVMALAPRPKSNRPKLGRPPKIRR
ncbi:MULTISPECIES: transcriptional regulator [unclassified Bradyrhizobium]|uniref:helix-turn-helix domain-containing transcriptional regulator n=1 Tax=unclassified Bradyrhizobium TaxID=2631580 RepID=UPI003391FB43